MEAVASLGVFTRDLEAMVRRDIVEHRGREPLSGPLEPGVTTTYLRRLEGQEDRAGEGGGGNWYLRGTLHT
jgi:hypothetical protein